MEYIKRFEDFNKINEAKRNYSTSLFKKDMKKLGWDFFETSKGQKFEKEITDVNGKQHRIQVFVHIHNNEGGNCVDPHSIQHVINNGLVKEYYLTGNTEFLDIAPWDKWGENRPSQEQLDNPTNFKEEVEEEEPKGVNPIEWANNRYKHVELQPIVNYSPLLYGTDMQLMIKKERKKTRYNICRNTEDKRPLSKMWFDGVWQDDTNKKKLRYGLGLARILKTKKEQQNGKYMFAIYPVNKNGVVVDDDFILENYEIVNFNKDINE